MPSAAALLQHLRALPARRPALLWLLAFVVMLQSAVPLLAAEAARVRGVAVADVCDVHGVRMPMAQEESASHSGPADHAPPAGSKPHCALTSLLGGSMAVAPMPAAVLLHAPPLAPAVTLVVPFTPHDAGLAWLAARLHAPPPSA